MMMIRRHWNCFFAVADRLAAEQVVVTAGRAVVAARAAAVLLVLLDYFAPLFFLALLNAA